jgi:hypothetical protein
MQVGNARKMDNPETDFDCRKNIRLMNTKIKDYENWRL